MNKTNWLRLGTIILVLICAYIFLIKQIPWNLIFLDTMVSGGDTGSHNYVAWYSKNIFPKLKWWSPDWYAGFPFLYFYPPLLYYLNDLLSFVLPFNISFKLITLLGTFFLPLALFFCLKLLGFEFPIPSLGAFLSLSYLFLEAFSIYGGNLPSTLAGEFSYSFAFGLFFLFIGLLFRDLRSKKISAFTVAVLVLMVLSHPFCVMVAVLVAILIFICSIFQKKIKETFNFLFKIFGLGFGLTAFWSLPFLALMGYTSKMTWSKVVKLEEIFPKALLPLELLGLATLVFALFKKDKKIIPLLLILVASFLPYLFLNQSSIWNTRFLPFILMTLILLAADGIGIIFQLIAKFFFSKSKQKYLLQTLVISCFVLSFVCLVEIRYLPTQISYLPFWLKWNYEGFETKNSWPELKQLFAFLQNLPPGRIMWEYRGEYDTFGTPRVLENLPIWTGHPTFEGLLIESAVSGYFHFINQAETTQTPTSAIAGLKYPSFDFSHGASHLQLFGAQYFLAYTPAIKQLAAEYFQKLAELGSFAIYRIPNSDLVQVVPRLELKPKEKTWIDEAINWYENLDFSSYLVFYQNKKELAELSPLVSNSYQAGGNIIIKEIKKDSLTFETENLYQPHLVKISYFPGWRVKGAKGPYLISPAFMMVIPTQKEVTLTFGYNFWDKLGFTILIFVLLWVVFPIIRKLFRFLLNLRRKFLVPQD